MLSKCVSLGQPGHRGCFCCGVWDDSFVMRDVGWFTEYICGHFSI